MAALMAGGVVVAGELWMPGQKLISIPSGKVFGNEYGIDSAFRLIGQNTVEYCGADDKVVSVDELYKWLRKNASYMLKGYSDPDSLMVTMVGDNRMINPEHLVNGSMSQRAGDQHMTDLREMWTNTETLGSDDFFTDKVYYAQMDDPRDRITELDTGHRGYR